MTIPTENTHAQNHATNKLLDGPKGAIFVQTVRGILNPLYDLDSNYQRYGDIYITQSSNFPSLVIISNPQAIQEVFTADSQLFKSVRQII